MKKMVIVLTSVMALTGFFLALVYASLKPAIDINREKALNESLTAVFGGTAYDHYETITADDKAAPGPTIYRGLDKTDRPVGYAVLIETGGYGGPIRLLLALSNDLATITGLEVVENVETPGLGGRITEDRFRNQFRGLSARTDILLTRNQKPDPAQNQAEAITGATISSRALVGGINRALGPAISLIKASLNEAGGGP